MPADMVNDYGWISAIEAGLLPLSPVSMNQIRVPSVMAYVPEPRLPKPGKGLFEMVNAGEPFPPQLIEHSVKPVFELLWYE
jgi:hypothetical protein